MPTQLDYGDQAGLQESNGFNARTTLPWKGDLLFRIYPADGKLYFIKVGASKHHNAAIHFGLIGALYAHFANKRAARRTEELIYNIDAAAPEQLLTMEKVNFAIEVDRITEPTIHPRSFWASKKFGSWTFRGPKGKKRTFTFDDAAGFQGAVARLSEAFGDRLTLKAQWDAAAGKVVRL